MSKPETHKGCFHCALPVPPGAHYQVIIEDEPREMCCRGCQAVAQTIVDNGLTDYYRHRTALPGIDTRPCHGGDGRQPQRALLGPVGVVEVRRGCATCTSGPDRGTEYARGPGTGTGGAAALLRRRPCRGRAGAGQHRSRRKRGIACAAQGT